MSHFLAFVPMRRPTDLKRTANVSEGLPTVSIRLVCVTVARLVSESGWTETLLIVQLPKFGLPPEISTPVEKAVEIRKFSYMTCVSRLFLTPVLDVPGGNGGKTGHVGTRLLRGLAS
jgi:hypothetical protein